MGDLELIGACSCGQIRYKLLAKPLYVHCCHCTNCQTESGSAFAINALIESDLIETNGNSLETIHTPTDSGKGQNIVRCSECKVPVWSHYLGLGQQVSFVKVGSLDDPNSCEPDIHIYTQSKQKWVQLPDSKPAYERYYDKKKLWPKESLKRLSALFETHRRS